MRPVAAARVRESKKAKFAYSACWVIRAIRERERISRAGSGAHHISLSADAARRVIKPTCQPALPAFLGVRVCVL